MANCVTIFIRYTFENGLLTARMSLGKVYMHMERYSSNIPTNNDPYQAGVID